MHRLRPALEAEGQAFEMVLEADRSVTRRVDGEARRLVEDDGLAIEEDHAVTEHGRALRSEEHTSELQSLMRISYAVFCLKKKMIHNEIVKTHIAAHTTCLAQNTSRVQLSYC